MSTYFSENKKMKIENEDFYKRLLLLIGTEEPFRFAKRIGIPNATFARILSEKSIPKHTHLCKIATQCDVSLDWLLTGKEKTTNTASNLLPVVGFAGCGLAQGWFDEQKFRVVLPFNVKNTDEAAFAVICQGLSMLPEGIEDGDVCIVSPKAPLKKGKPVLVRTKTLLKGKEVFLSAVKRYEGQTKKGIRLCGWLDPDETGNQISFLEERADSVIQNVYAVIQIIKNADVFGNKGKESFFRRDVLIKCFDSLKPFVQNTDSQHLADLFQLFYQKNLKNEE